MKNYVVTSLHRFEESIQEGVGAPTMMGYQVYEEMEQYHRRGLEKHLEGDWEYILFSGESKNAADMFRKQYLFLWELWKKEPCNILYCGPDTIARNKFDIFNDENISEMRMFNYTVPKQYKDIEHYFNADVVYYPSTMENFLWDYGESLWKEADYKWNCDQYVLNKMFWSQPGMDINTAHLPLMNYNMKWYPSMGYCETFNGVNFEDSVILHFNASSSDPRPYMKNLEESEYNNLG